MVVRDLGSQNGTVLVRVGREIKLGEETVSAGDTLRFGEITIPAREIFDALTGRSAEPVPAACDHRERGRASP